MKSIKVNADYESVLFYNKPLPLMNESLEFLALYLSEKPLLSQKKYSDSFLDHVESFTGQRPLIVKDRPYENWWGELRDIELERKLNSKEMSSEFYNDNFILESIDQLPVLAGDTYLAKNPFGMSGQNFSLVEEGRLQNLEIMLKKGKVILEPFFDRLYDFSHYVYPNGMSVCYQNIVDHKFQYRGTVFNDYTAPIAENLSFYKKIDLIVWEKFKQEMILIQKKYHRNEAKSGFSIDSFVYNLSDNLFIRAISEVNYRRTMGQVAFELSVKFGGIRKWSAFVLCKSKGIGFLEMKKKLLELEWEPETSRGVIILSPGDVRYDIFFLSAINEEEGRYLLKEMSDLLPSAEFSIVL